MTFPALMLLFPIVLGIHNTEEYLRFDDFIRTYHSRLPAKLTTRCVVRNAAILLTVAAAVLAALTYLQRAQALFAVSRVAILALMLNAVGHCALSLKKHAVTPGTVSAVALILPYSVVSVVVMHTQLGDSLALLVFSAAVGAVATPLAVALSLGIGYLCCRFQTFIAPR